MNSRSFLYFAFKIKDGLFIGDMNSPNEKDFLASNKITSIVNCASSQIKINANPNIKVISYDWLDQDNQVILDESDQTINQILDFMNNSYDNSESILVCSVRGQSRALTIITAFIMRRFEWSLYKTLEYMNSKRSDFEIRATFLRQLLAFEQRSFGTGNQQSCSKNWKDDNVNNQDAILVKNTFLNGQLGNERHDKRQNTEFQSYMSKTIKWPQQIETLIVDKPISELTPFKPDEIPQKSILKTKKKFPQDNLINLQQKVSKKIHLNSITEPELKKIHEVDDDDQNTIQNEQNSLSNDANSPQPNNVINQIKFPIQSQNTQQDNNLIQQNLKNLQSQRNQMLFKNMNQRKHYSPSPSPAQNYRQQIKKSNTPQYSPVNEPITHNQRSQSNNFLQMNNDMNNIASQSQQNTFQININFNLNQQQKQLQHNMIHSQQQQTEQVNQIPPHPPKVSNYFQKSPYFPNLQQNHSILLERLRRPPIKNSTPQPSRNTRFQSQSEHTSPENSGRFQFENSGRFQPENINNRIILRHPPPKTPQDLQNYLQNEDVKILKSSKSRLQKTQTPLRSQSQNQRQKTQNQITVNRGQQERMWTEFSRNLARSSGLSMYQQRERVGKGDKYSSLSKKKSQQPINLL